MVQKVPASMTAEGVTAAQLATKLSGDVIQKVTVNTSGMATGATAIPYDDTIPQVTEGTLFQQLSITPTAATSTLEVDVLAFASCASAAAISWALFRDGAADAVAAGNYNLSAGTGMFPVPLHYEVAAGSTAGTTFTLRIGANNGAAITLNGTSGARVFGGVCNSRMTIREIKA